MMVVCLLLLTMGFAVIASAAHDGQEIRLSQ